MICVLVRLSCWCVVVQAVAVHRANGRVAAAAAEIFGNTRAWIHTEDTTAAEDPISWLQQRAVLVQSTYRHTVCTHAPAPVGLGGFATLGCAAVPGAPLGVAPLDFGLAPLALGLWWLSPAPEHPKSQPYVTRQITLKPTHLILHKTASASQ